MNEGLEFWNKDNNGTCTEIVTIEDLALKLADIADTCCYRDGAHREWLNRLFLAMLKDMIPTITFNKWPAEVMQKKFTPPLEYLFHRIIDQDGMNIHCFLPNGACGDKKQFAIISKDLEEAKKKAIEAYE